MRTSQELYKYHVANVRRVDYALGRIALNIRSAIAEKDEKTTSSFLPLYMLLLGVWAECRLRKLLYEKNAFSAPDRLSIDSKQTHFEKWQKVVELVFRKRYSIPRAPLHSTLPFTPAARYIEINDLLEKDLKNIIEIRNRLAHGQWEYLLTNTGDDVSTDLMHLMKTENLLSLQLKKNLLSSLLDIIHDLAISEPTFIRDFDNHYRRITEVRRHLQNRSYQEYVDLLINKKKKGLAKKPKP